MARGVDELSDSDGDEARAVLQALYTEAIDTPERFGAIRLFRFKGLPGAILSILPATNNMKGVVAFYLGRQGSMKFAVDRAAAALNRFIPTYLRAMQEPIDHPEFIEVPPSERNAELARARAELSDPRTATLLLSFEGYSFPLPPAAGAQAQAEAARRTSEELSVALVEFAARATAGGPWDERPECPHKELVEEQSVFFLIAGGVLAGLLPVRNTVLPIMSDDVGVEVFRLEERPVTLVVLYTGDPTATYASLNVPEGLTEEERVALAKEAFDFLIDCGVLTGRPEAPPEPSRFVRVMDEEELSTRLAAGLHQDDLNIDLVNADSPTDRPSDLTFAVLAQWALGANPPILRTEDGKAPAIDQVRVFRHRKIPLATLLAVTHSGGAAMSVAGCYPIDMPDEDWPELDDAFDRSSLVVPKEFEELPPAEGAQQLRRALAMLEGGSAIDEGFPVIGLPSQDIQQVLVQAAAEQREIEFQEDLLSFEGILLTWLRGEEDALTRPASFVARHRKDPELLMIGAGFSDEQGLRSYLVVNQDGKVDVKDVIARLNEVNPEDALDAVLEHVEFEMLDSDEARETIFKVVTHLKTRTTVVYDLAPIELTH